MFLYVGMVSQGFGHIVNISSVAGKMAVPVRSSYAAAKHAIIGMMDGVRLEVCEFSLVSPSGNVEGPVHEPPLTL